MNSVILMTNPKKIIPLEIVPEFIIHFIESKKTRSEQPTNQPAVNQRTLHYKEIAVLFCFRF